MVEHNLTITLAQGELRIECTCGAIWTTNDEAHNPGIAGYPHWKCPHTNTVYNHIFSNTLILVWRITKKDLTHSPLTIELDSDGATATCGGKDCDAKWTIYAGLDARTALLPSLSAHRCPNHNFMLNQLFMDILHLCSLTIPTEVAP